MPDILLNVIEMRILILARGVPNEHDPQEGCFEFDQAKALKSAGHEVVIMAVDSRVRKFRRKFGVEKKIIDGIPTYKLFLFPTSIVRRLISFRLGVNLEASEAIWLYKYVVGKEGDFDILHGHFLTSIYYAARIKSKYGIKIIGTEHWSKVNTSRPSSDIIYMGNRAYPQLEKLISVSDSLRMRIKENFNVDSKVIHNLIDTSNLRPLTETCKNEGKNFKIVLVGSLIRRKGFDFFINAFAKSSLAKKNDTEVVIIGGGGEYNRLKEQIISLDLSGKISLIGQKPKNKIFDELHSASLFVLPSRNENFSVSVLEALANGLPVIATICGGIRECIDSKNGMLVEVDNEQEMVDALESMYENHDSFDRSKIRESALSQYSPESIAKMLNEVYSEVR